MVSAGQKPKKIDALLISHRYDDEALFITIPEIYEKHSLAFGEPDSKQAKLFYQEFIVMLDEIGKLLSLNTTIQPDFKKTAAVGSSQQTFDIDQTNRNPFGKILVEVGSLRHFPFYHNIFVRIYCNPFVLNTRKILDAQLDFRQRFFIPVHNHFNTLKVEIINLLMDGWFREHVKETIIASFEIRLPDIDKEPFDENGNIKLVLPEQ